MRVIDIAFKLTLWFLLTGDTSLANAAIGAVIALLLPPLNDRPVAGASVPLWKEWLQMLWRIAIAIPKAYIEAVEMMLQPHTVEEMVVECIPHRQTRGLIFLDIFLITFTPKTIVVDYSTDASGVGEYLVHSVSRRKKQ